MAPRSTGATGGLRRGTEYAIHVMFPSCVLRLNTSLKRKIGKGWRIAIIAWAALAEITTGTPGFNLNVHIPVNVTVTEISMVQHVEQRLHGEASASGG